MLCPGLKRVTFLHFSAVSDEDLIAFLLARTDPHLPPESRLTSARVEITRARQRDIIPALQQRIEAGLRVSLRYGLPPPAVPYSVSHGNQQDSHDWDPVSSYEYLDKEFG
ncbi:hypothetical protein B0H16DRAFT_1453585 [Mycena metata]|uniref:Uncharacterized protein n=1 Tax=Mycena metata TaxID=1033252 RepID=A0AAD7JLB0_9AGAR|nr:hypothetical protein B0H16DRAFT_1453585 [Mycena metata]